MKCPKCWFDIRMGPYMHPCVKLDVLLLLYHPVLSLLTTHNIASLSYSFDFTCVFMRKFRISCFQSYPVYVLQIPRLCIHCATNMVLQLSMICFYIPHKLCIHSFSTYSIIPRICVICICRFIFVVITDGFVDYVVICLI